MSLSYTGVGAERCAPGVVSFMASSESRDDRESALPAAICLNKLAQNPDVSGVILFGSGGRDKQAAGPRCGSGGGLHEGFFEE